MSIAIMTDVWKLSQHSGSDLLLLLAIADNANDHACAWPSIPCLAEKTRMSERQVIRIIKRLEESAELQVERRANTVSRYLVTIANPTTVAVDRLSTDKLSPPDKMSPLQMSPRHDTVMSPRHDIAVSSGIINNINESSLFSEVPSSKQSSQSQIAQQMKEYVEMIWKEYPRKKAKGQAEKAIKSAIKRVVAGEAHEGRIVIVTAAVNFLAQRTRYFAATCARLTREEMHFVPYPATWFNGKRYLEESHTETPESDSMPASASAKVNRALGREKK